MATFVDGAPPFEAKYFKKKLLKIEQNGEQYEKIQTFFYKNNSVTILNEKKTIFRDFSGRTATLTCLPRNRKHPGSRDELATTKLIQRVLFISR